MKFTTSLAALYALVNAMTASAAPSPAPVQARQSTFVPGAAYFMTNMPGGNTLLSADIGSDGTLTLANAYTTWGAGAHGADGVNGPDALFSQGSVQVHAASGLLGVANAGSHTVSLFKIDPTSPSNLTQIGQPVASGGEFPMSMAFNANGTMLCVLNGGAVNGIKCFGVNPEQGFLTLSDSWRSLGVKQVTPPTGPANTTSHVIFTEDQSSLVAAVKGDPTTGIPGFLAVWSVNPDLTLSSMYSRVELPAGSLLPFSLSNIPGQKALFGSDAAVGTVVFDLTNGTTSAVASPRTATLAIQGQAATCWNVRSSQTGNWYVSDDLTNLVTEVSVDNNLSQRVVAQYATLPAAGALDMDIASVSGKDYLYTMLANATSVAVMALNGPAQATLVQTLDLSPSLQAAQIPFAAPNFMGMAVYATPTTA